MIPTVSSCFSQSFVSHLSPHVDSTHNASGGGGLQYGQTEPVVESKLDSVGIAQEDTARCGYKAGTQVLT